MVAPPRRHLCRVFSGLHSGAEMPLGDGSLVLGSDEECDVILSDPGVAPKHARLDVTNGSVRCTSLEGATVLVSGRPISAGGRTLNHGEYFTLGTTHLAIGPADAPWPTMAPPELALDEPLDDEPALEHASTSNTPAAPAQPERAAAPGTWSPVLWFLLCNALVFLALLVGLWWFVLQPGGSGDVATPLRAVIQRHNDQGSMLKLAQDGRRWVVSGHVNQPEDLQRLRDEVRDVHRATLVEVCDTHALADAVQGVLAAQRMDLKAACGEPGEVIVSGRPPDPTRWAVVRKRILADVPALRRLSDEQLLKNLTSHNSASGSTGFDGDESDEPGETAGEAGSEEASPPDPDAVAPSTKAGGPSLGHGLPPTLTNPLPELVVELRSVSIGANRSLTTPSGKRLFPGAVLPGGYRIREIRDDGLVLVKEGEESFYPLGGSE